MNLRRLSASLGWHILLSNRMTSADADGFEFCRGLAA